jgi:hypothetical protein
MMMMMMMMMMMRRRRRRRRRGKGYFSSPKACTPSPGPTKPSVEWVPGFICMEIKRPGREAGKSVPSSAELKNERSSKPPPSMCLNGMYRENFIFLSLFCDMVVFKKIYRTVNLVK